MNFLSLFHFLVYFFLVQYFLLPYICYGRFLWVWFLEGVVYIFGFLVSSPLVSIMSGGYFLLMMFSCFYGHLFWNMTLGRIVEFTFTWALIGWLITFFILMSEEVLTNVFGLYGEGYKGVVYAIWGKMSTVFVRPFSLSLRLTINLMVGHFFMMGWIYSKENLSGSLGVMSFIKMHLGLYFIVLFEFCVFILQSFIFSRLLGIYLEEV